MGLDCGDNGFCVCCTDYFKIWKERTGRGKLIVDIVILDSAFVVISGVVVLDLVNGSIRRG